MQVDDPVSPITYLAIGLFLCTAPGLLAWRYLSRKPSWWVIAPAIIIVGWAMLLFAVLSYFDDLQTHVSRIENPDPALVERAMSDGGPMVFAALFGWMLASVYGLAWWLIFLFVVGLGNAAQSRKSIR